MLHPTLSARDAAGRLETQPIELKGKTGASALPAAPDCIKGGADVVVVLFSYRFFINRF
jgi:hypothetical protein